MSKKISTLIARKKRQAKIDATFIIGIAGLTTAAMIKSGCFVDFPLNSTYLIPVFGLWAGANTLNEPIAGEDLEETIKNSDQSTPSKKD